MRSSFLVFVFITILKICWTSVTPFIPNHVASLVHAPHFDSAVVHSSRIGPNFAYSTVERHAYQALAPIAHNGLYHYESVPLTLPQSQYIYLQNPILTNFGVPHKPKEDVPTELDNGKIDDDTITIESA